ncbi:diguanylate cyclase [Petroclostridium sp. X23]|uniref:sensor domain-containing diguanylate cyclase/phosphohydrolase n=1 Tax=Petroclostridium sp. X23 TaxID=3045146 RepID=UPI0024AD1A26|nr:diguanylate cyclase [Petroclostridium sp. X23]WHH58519.1 diguanylate cyclase [Petroclostridium sp. X23]
MSTDMFEKELFKKEFEVLEEAAADINDLRYEGNELLDNYGQLVLQYEKLLKLTKKIFRISDTQGEELKRRENEIKNLLDNSDQGFLTFGKDLIVNKEYSVECFRIFNKKIANMNILELLAGLNSDQNNLFEETFKKVFEVEDMDIKTSYLNKLPNVLKINDNYVSIKYKIIHQDGFTIKNDALMLVLTDITEKRKAEDQVLYLSYHDKLTSLYNRAYIDSIASQLQSHQNMPLSIILGDMNGLKLTNDVFGHKYGDKLLIHIAEVFLACCGRNDIAARWGGDEFLIILPNTGYDRCKAICAEIKKQCGNIPPDPIEVSVSLGIATMENPNTKISELFNIAENMMYSNKLAESKSVRRKIILGIEKTLHTKCFEDKGHIERVKKMALDFAKTLDIASDSIEMTNLPLLASFHDIGKVAIPQEILGKEGSLTNNEWEIMKSHTEIGYRMAQSIEEPVLAQAILAMRERWDGAGYPYGLKQNQIPYISRIIAILDAYDVMTHHRPYKSALSKEDALKELMRCRGTQFDPDLISKFLQHIRRVS